MFDMDLGQQEIRHDLHAFMSQTSDFISAIDEKPSQAAQTLVEDTTAAMESLKADYEKQLSDLRQKLSEDT